MTLLSSYSTSIIIFIIVGDFLLFLTLGKSFRTDLSGWFSLGPTNNLSRQISSDGYWRIKTIKKIKTDNDGVGCGEGYHSIFRVNYCIPGHIKSDFGHATVYPSYQSTTQLLYHRTSTKRGITSRVDVNLQGYYYFSVLLLTGLQKVGTAGTGGAGEKSDLRGRSVYFQHFRGKICDLFLLLGTRKQNIFRSPCCYDSSERIRNIRSSGSSSSSSSSSSTSVSADNDCIV